MGESNPISRLLAAASSPNSARAAQTVDDVEGIINEQEWLDNWTQGMCEMAGDCPGPDCEDCRQRMADKVVSGSATVRVTSTVNTVRKAVSGRR